MAESRLLKPEIREGWKCAVIHNKGQNVNDMLQIHGNLLLDIQWISSVDHLEGGYGIHHAAVRHCLEVLKIIYKQRPQDLNKPAVFSRTPLHWASQCSAGNLDVVKYLIRKGASIDAQDDDGCTALYYATYANNAKVVELLLKERADLTIKNRRNNESAFDLAIKQKHEDIIKAFCDNGMTMGELITMIVESKDEEFEEERKRKKTEMENLREKLQQLENQNDSYERKLQQLNDENKQLQNKVQTMPACSNQSEEALRTKAMAVLLNSESEEIPSQIPRKNEKGDFTQCEKSGVLPPEVREMIKPFTIGQIQNELLKWKKDFIEPLQASLKSINDKVNQQESSTTNVVKQKIKTIENDIKISQENMMDLQCSHKKVEGELRELKDAQRQIQRESKFRQPTADNHCCCCPFLLDSETGSSMSTISEDAANVDQGTAHEDYKYMEREIAVCGSCSRDTSNSTCKNTRDSRRDIEESMEEKGSVRGKPQETADTEEKLPLHPSSCLQERTSVRRIESSSSIASCSSSTEAVCRKVTPHNANPDPNNGPTRDPP